MAIRGNDMDFEQLDLALEEVAAPFDDQITAKGAEIEAVLAPEHRHLVVSAKGMAPGAYALSSEVVRT